MNKKIRQQIFDKYGGKCAYCGCELLKGWHVDEIEPVRRNYSQDYDYDKQRHVRRLHGVTHPERFNIDNQNPSCASCNINKHSESLENFRSLISGFKNHLNQLNTQYKISKRYGLVVEVDKPVVFYFETLNTPPCKK